MTRQYKRKENKYSQLFSSLLFLVLILVSGPLGREELGTPRLVSLSSSADDWIQPWLALNISFCNSTRVLVVRMHHCETRGVCRREPGSGA